MNEPGSVVIKTAGREKGKYAVILEKIDDSFVLITGPKSVTGVKRRKCNMNHIEPTEHKLEISSGDDDSIIEKSWKDSGLVEKLEIRVPKKSIKETPVEKKKKSK